MEIQRDPEAFGIPHLRARLHIVKRRLTSLGARLAASASDPQLSVAVADASYIQAAARRIAGGSSASSSTEFSELGERMRAWEQRAACGEPAPAVVSPLWMESVLATGKQQPVDTYLLTLSAASSSAASAAAAAAPGPVGSAGTPPASPALSGARDARGAHAQSLGPPWQVGPAGPAPSADAPMASYAPWLGYWGPELDGVTNRVELVLWGSFRRARSEALGNEPVVQALRELSRMEEAIGGPRTDVTSRGVTEGAVNHNALTYAHAAAAVRGCAFPLLPSHSEGFLKRFLPFVGDHIARVIRALLATGTCEQLEGFRSDQPVTSGCGRLRPDTAGGATRRRFVQIPGVGARQAARWYRLGLHTYEQLEAAAEPGGALDPHADGGEGSISQEALYCLRHRADLLQPVSEADVAEMRASVEAALAEVSGVSDGWVIEQVGGGRRTGQVHDADWLVTHPRVRMAGVVQPLCAALVAAGRLVGPREGFCRVQGDTHEGYLARARADAGLEKWPERHQMDRYPHIFGVYISRVGTRRRMDVILVPNHRWPWALLGWTGSKQWLRFLRQHVGNCGMFLNSHCLMRRVMLPPAQAADINEHSDAPTVSFTPSPAQHSASASRGDGTPASQARNAAKPAGSTSSSSSEIVISTRAAQGPWPPPPHGGEQPAVLVVPEEVAPSDRGGTTRWPPGWAPGEEAQVSLAPCDQAAPSCDGTAISPGAARCAAAPAGPGPGSVPPSGPGASHASKAEAAAVRRAYQGCLWAASGLLLEPGKPRVLRGRGSARAVVTEEDIFELLGLPYRTPAERDCP